METVEIGFIGAGLMGRGMVRNLLAKGHGVRLIAHRSRTVIDELKALGASEASDHAALAQGASVILLCVTDSPAVAQVMEKLLPHLIPGQVVIDCSTSLPAESQRWAGILEARGIAFADAPLAGGTLQADEGTLGVLLGCEEDLIPRIEPILSAFASRVRRFGPVGAGHRAKLLNNYLVMGMIALVTETYRGARSAGIDWAMLHDVMQNGAAKSGVLTKMVEPALKGDFNGYQFAISNALKDVRYYRRSLANSPLAREIESFFAAQPDGAANVSRLLDPEFI